MLDPLTVLIGVVVVALLFSQISNERQVEDLQRRLEALEYRVGGVDEAASEKWEEER